MKQAASTCTSTARHVPQRKDARPTLQLTSKTQPDGDSQPVADAQFCTLHQIICHSGFHTRNGKLFTNPPTWTLDKSTNIYDTRAHLSSTDAVHNIPEFIKRSGDISFIVFRYYRCSDATRWDYARTGDPSNARYDETIGIVSQPLQEAVDRLSRCVSDPGSYYQEPANSAGPNQNQDDQQFDQDEYTMEYFYHHKHILDDAVDQAGGALRSQIAALRMYVNTQYGRVFGEMDELAAQGMVKSHDIHLLFCPNEIVVTNQSGVLTAYVLRAWPTKGKKIGLECWNWAYDGHSLRRKQCQLAINRPIQPIVNIRDLEVYPLRFATEEEVSYLELRGRKFWSLRHQSFVAYDGWDFNTEHYYVGAQPPFTLRELS